MVFVIPCYNEEAALHVTAGVLKSKLQDLKDAGQIASDSSVVFVDDGSADKTWDVITSLHNEYVAFAAAIEIYLDVDIRLLGGAVSSSTMV